MTFQIDSAQIGPTNPTAGTYTIALPIGARILRARIRTQGNKLTLWYLHDTAVGGTADRTIAALEVGVPITEEVSAMRMIGYGQSAGALLHLFELYFSGQGGVLDDEGGA